MSHRPRWLTRGAGRSGQAAARRAGRAGPASSRARFERRAARARRRPLRLVGAFLALVAVVVAAVWAVGFSSLLVVRSASVEGVPDSERAAVLAAAEVPFGVPLARLDTAVVERRVRQVPTVSSVTVRRSWPSTVVIAVLPKVPVIGLRNPQGQLQVADSAGTVFQVVDALPPGVPLVTSGSAAPAPDGVRAAIGVLELLPAAQRSAVTDVTVSGSGLVTFRLGTVTVVWGGEQDGPRKLKVLNALLATTPTLVDVSAPDTPVTR